MVTAKSLRNNLSNISESSFESHALALFKWQVEHNKVYNAYVKNLGIAPNTITQLEQIPFLPIQFFKSHRVVSGTWHVDVAFTSSGTTGSVVSKHFVASEKLYKEHSLRLFQNTFGPIVNCNVLALLPSYLEREGSSLISMVSYLIEQSNSQFSGFYLHNLDALIATLTKLKTNPRKTVLFGVTFAFLELAEQFELDLSHVILIETGGMKGRGNELTRTELYKILTNRLNPAAIYSEYGMTELLSQAYGFNGLFVLPNCMKVLLRQVNDPFDYVGYGQTGGINIIDLANVDSCAFIETQDLGRLHSNGTFEVLGRFDNSDLRGCNLLVQ